MVASVWGMCNAWFAAFSSTPNGLERTQDMRTGPRAAWRSDRARRPLLDTTRALALRQWACARSARLCANQFVAPVAARRGGLVYAESERRGEANAPMNGPHTATHTPSLYATVTDQTGLNVIMGDQRSSATATNLPCCRSLPRPPPYSQGSHHALLLTTSPRIALSRAPLAECRGIEYPRNPCLTRFTSVSRTAVSR